MFVRHLVKSPLLALAALAVCTTPAAAQTFGFSGGQQTYTVPAGITKLDVSMSGADGGEGGGNGSGALSPGGHGGTASAVLTVSAGEQLFVEVGGAGGNGGGSDQGAQPAAGFNGGGTPYSDPDPDCCGEPYGGSGGGASDIRTVSSGAANTLNSRLLVAGGGGGGGFNATPADASGSNASASASPPAVTGIQGGSAGASGPGGGGAACVVSFADDANGNAGVFGTGGNGGTSAWNASAGVLVASGGGGGGGYYGGGGGAGCINTSTVQSTGGGGGGSDFASSAASSVAFGVDGTAAANGGVTINPAAPGLQTAPAVKGTFVSGNTLSVVAGMYTNPPTKRTYQWFRCNASGAGCTAISGATGTIWPLTGADVGHTIKVQETASNAFATAAAATSAATPVIANPPTTGGPSSGNPSGGAPGTGGTAPAVVPTHLRLDSVKMAGSHATLHLTCAGAPGTCQGAIAIKAAAAGKGKHHPATKRTAKKAKPAKHKAKQLTVDKASFKLDSGKAMKLKLKLDKAGLEMLDKTYRLPADLTVSGTTKLHRQIEFAYPRVRSIVSWTWSFTGSHTNVAQLQVTRIPHKGRVTVLCDGGGCLTDHISLTTKHGGPLALTTAVTNGTLRAGARLQITISAPNHVAKVVEIMFRRNHYPDVTFACEPPGISKPTACAAT